MSADAGSKPPKTLADVSHLFFSKVEGRSDDAPAASADARATEAPVAHRGVHADDSPAVSPTVSPTVSAPVAETKEKAAPAQETEHPATRVFVVTGADDAPGKSTIAVNLAHFLMPFGRVALFDADPRVPNARFYLGLPSWNYLSPLIGGGEPVQTAVTDRGLVVVDWVNGAASEDRGISSADLPEYGRKSLDFAVVDLPLGRGDVLSALAPKRPVYIVAARTGLAGFENAFAVLKTLRVEGEAQKAALVVNRAPDDDYALAFHAKTEAAAGRLLRMEVGFLGGVPAEPGLGGEQRERGAIVSSRPSAAVALSLRQAASNALDLAGDGRPAADGPRRVARGENRA